MPLLETTLYYLTFLAFTYLPPLILICWGLYIYKLLPKKWDTLKKAPLWFNYLRVIISILTPFFCWLVLFCSRGMQYPAITALFIFFYILAFIWGLTEYDILACFGKRQAANWLRNVLALAGIVVSIITYAWVLGIPMERPASIQGTPLQGYQQLFNFAYLYLSLVVFIYWALWSFNKLPKLPKKYAQSLVITNTSRALALLLCLSVFTGNGIHLLSHKNIISWALLLVYINAMSSLLVANDIFSKLKQNESTTLNRRLFVFISLGLVIFQLITG